ncbi:MAG: fibronectin type III domain-containing protein [Kofleriaceae bacterium]
MTARPSVLAIVAAFALSACADQSARDVIDGGPPPIGGPSAPADLRATPTSDTSISLAWMDTSSDEAGFVLERATAEAGPYLPVSTTAANATSYVDTGLTAATTYFYRAHATGAAGSSASTAVASARTQDAPSTPPGDSPATPDGLVANGMAADAIELRWTDHAANETGFRVERARAAAGPFSEVTTTAANLAHYTDVGLAAATTYYYRVRATNSAGNSAYTAVASGTTQALPAMAPSVPTDLVASAQSSSTIRLTWSDTSTNETGFKVERATAAGGPFSQVVAVAANTTTRDDGGLASGTTYFYRVRATNAAGDSDPTGVASATTSANQICTPSATRCVAGAITSLQTCNSAGSDWVTGACPAFSLCSNSQCRVVCELSSAPTNPTLCVVPNQDGVNNGEWLYWSDSRLASPANTHGGSIRSGGGGGAPVISSGQAWPYAWSMSPTDNAFTQFKLNQFSFPRSQRLSFRAKRAGVLTSAVNNYLVGIFNGQSSSISQCIFGPVPFGYTTTSCFNGPPFGSQLSYNGTFNSMLLGITGDGFGGPIDILDVNWIALSIEP